MKSGKSYQANCRNTNFKISFAYKKHMISQKRFKSRFQLAKILLKTLEKIQLMLNKQIINDKPT